MASEYRYADPIVDEKTLVIAITQSGETTDTLAAVEAARDLGGRVLAVTNTQGSLITREADAVLLTKAGPEICVASTKTFLAQVAALELLALELIGPPPKSTAATSCGYQTATDDDRARCGRRSWTRVL